MWVVFKLMRYIDDPEVRLIAVFKDEGSAKTFAELQNADVKLVPCF